VVACMGSAASQRARGTREGKRTTGGDMEQKDMVSRRNFIKTSGVVALGAAALGLAGCGPKPAQNAANDAATSVADISWDEEYDVVVVGAGAAGLATAVAMATEGGDNTTLLLEKGATPIGSG